MRNIGIVTIRVMPPEGAKTHFTVQRTEMTAYGVVRVYGRGNTVRAAREAALQKHGEELDRRVRRYSKPSKGDDVA